MTQLLHDLNFNTEPAKFMHIDLNSCFATIEQQANPLLRHKPIAVAAYNSPRGTILAASIESKRLGIKTGFRVFEAKQICPEIIILTPDTEKYRFVHHQLKKLLSDYTNRFYAKSVDEFVLNFTGAYKYSNDLILAGKEIKERIKDEIGDYITVSIGISKNQFLAKQASNLKKPDGLEEISENNFLEIYEKLSLTDLCGIGNKSMIKLNSFNIFSVKDFYEARPEFLRNAFKSIFGYYWYLKLRGYEIEEYEHKRKSFSHEYSLPKPMKDLKELSPIIVKLVEKLGQRMRNEGYEARGVALALRYKDHTAWHMSANTKKVIFTSSEIYKEIINLFFKSPKKDIGLVSVGCFNLRERGNLQLSLFENTVKKDFLTKMLDKINNRWGAFVISPASMANSNEFVHDRIGFGNVG